MSDPEAFLEREMHSAIAPEPDRPREACAICAGIPPRGAVEDAWPPAADRLWDLVRRGGEAFGAVGAWARQHADGSWILHDAPTKEEVLPLLTAEEREDVQVRDILTARTFSLARLEETMQALHSGRLRVGPGCTGSTTIASGSGSIPTATHISGAAASALLPPKWSVAAWRRSVSGTTSE